MKLKRWVWVSIAVLLVAILAVLIQVRREHSAPRVFVIGWERTPPTQIEGPNGEPIGYTTELIQEAARRRGIRLKWVEHRHNADGALTNRLVDLWSRLNVTEERKRRYHMTRPYQERSYIFLVRSDSPYRFVQDLKNIKVAYDGIPIGGQLLGERFPQLEQVSANGLGDAIERLCRGEVGAVFGDRYIAFSTMIEAHPSCSAMSLRVIPIVNFRTYLAIAAVRNADAPAAAEAMRDELDKMVDDGTAERIASYWGDPASQGLLSLNLLRDTRRSLWRYRVGSAVVGLLCLFAIWVAVAYRRACNRAEATGQVLRQTERNLRLLASSLSEMVLAFDHERRLIYANPGARHLTGYSLAELQSAEFACWVHPDDRATVLAAWERAYCGEKVEQVTYQILTRTGERRWVSANWGPIYDETGKPIGVQASERDISERVRADEERTALQEQLLQSQKLESVGRLAGGIAHDFNNILTVIIGFGYLLLAESPDANAKGHANEIVKAASRAAELTSQLLAFSRKQVIQPRLLRINELIEDTSRMMRRLIGEDIELRLVLHPAPYPILADPGQINQVLINLAANARDAIPGVGSLVIETTNVTLDGNYAASHAEVVPGDYLQLTFTDSGAGMDQATLSRIFEPFFTTKATGRGTGLGLATVYGIVKQAGGHIWAYSELGQGTTFKLYFPRTYATQAPEETLEPKAVRSSREETILVVEDQLEVRDLILQMLRLEGYRVVEADSGAAGLALAQQHQGPIALVITDVVMPDMNGRQLADKLTEVRPGIKILFMSGYTEDVVAHRGILDPGIQFISKPFTPATLAARVRKILEQAEPVS
jgi:PAS domain S-box-containing protein